MPVKNIRKDVIVFIAGPTAVGKTAFSIKLAGRIKGEIVSADSMQIYKGMRILSQAPAISQRKGVQHYLVGIMDPRREYSVASFRKTASGIIRSISKRGKVPIVVGGSGLYVKGLIDGLFPSPPADPRFRKAMERFAARHGSARLHEKLTKVDAGSAAHIHPNDIRRAIRALEIHRLTGRTMTELKASTRGLADQYDIKIFGLTKPRAALYAGIDSRVERMFKAGVVNEVKRLKNLKRLSRTARCVLGFKEIAAAIGGIYGLEAAKELLKRNTRRFAKRQLTWFRADSRINWLDISRMSEKDGIRHILRKTMLSD